MLQRLLLITLTLCSLSASAQWQQTGSKVRYVNGIGIPTKDTAAGISADSSQILIRPADSSLYVKYKRTWMRVGGGGGSIAGGGSFNYVPKFTGSSSIGNSLIYDDGSLIGIGTATPNSFLDVRGSATFKITSPRILIEDNDNNGTASIWFRPQNASFNTRGAIDLISAGSGAAGEFRFSAGATGGTGNAAHYMSFYTAALERMRIDNAGNVGIGTTSPGQKLSITGGNILQTGSNDVSAIYHQTLTSASSGGGLWGVEGSTSGSLLSGTTPYATVISSTSSGTQLQFGTGGSIKATITSGGNLLIGTTTDNGTDKLQVSGSAIATTLKVNTSGQTVTISSYYNGGIGKNIWIGGGGLSSNSTASDNVSVGYNALLNNTSGYANVAMGSDALKANTTGYYNFGIGNSALTTNTTGNFNTAIGASALATLNSSNNVGIGSNSLVFTTSGGSNTVIGSNAMFWNTTGSSNIAIGYIAGYSISGGGNNTNPSQSIFIGEDTRPSANGNTNEIVIGHTNIGQGSNTVTLGNSSITKTFLRGSTMVNTTSDNGVDKLQVNGSISGIGMKQAYVTKTGAYTATDADYVIDCTSGTFTVTLPASSGRTGRILIIKNSGTGTITVDGNAAETIDGAATYAISVQYGTVQIMSDGTNWKIIAKF